MTNIQLFDLEAQLEGLGVSKNSGSKFPESPYLSVGTYAVKVVDIVVKGPNRLDPTWVDVELTVEGPNNKTRRGTVSAPTKKLTYGKYDSKSQFYKFKDLARALGVQQSELSEKLPDVVEKLINESASVVGAALEVEVGYDSTHVKKIDGQWQIVNYKGEPHPLFEGQSFAERDAALAAAKLKQVWVQSSPTLVKYKPSAEGSGITIGGKSTKTTITKKAPKNQPF